MKVYQWSSCRLCGVMLAGHEDRVIAENIRVRFAPPVDVFCYPLVDSWRDRVWSMLADYITGDVKEEFVRDPPEWVMSDDLSWLDDLIFGVTGEICNIKELTASRLCEEFWAFRAAHGTRTNDLAQFYQHGLRILRPKEIENRARSIFLNDKFKNATEERLQQAIDEVDARNLSGGREGRIYFCADEASLTGCTGGAGHYLVYGSEYLYCLGRRLTSSSNAKDVLKGIGRPTIFVCDIPMKAMRSSTLHEFAGMIIEYLFCELVEGLEAHALSPGAGSALSLTTDLPAAHIVGHYHPTKVYDPLWSA